MLSDVQLRVVPTELVLSHELADAGRERRIEQRLAHDGILRDPLLVAAIPDVEGYVLLDGTNRKRAIEARGLSGLLAQVVDYAHPRAVQLRTWCHAASLPLSDFLDKLAAIRDVEIATLSPLAAPDALRDADTLALLLDRTQHVAVTRRRTGESRPSQLRRLVAIYEHRFTRVDCDPDDVEDLAATVQGPRGEAACLVAFPPFTRAQVVALALKGTLIPAGITRHIILSGRALRVNLPLDLLELRDGLAEANSALEAHLRALTPRSYSEPTILFDS